MHHSCGVFTGNVDGQFQRTGFGEARIVECHGSLHHLQCTRPFSEAIWPADEFAPKVDAEACRLLNTPPTCPWCGALARPNVLMFGDWAWFEQRARQQELRLSSWLRGVRRLVVIELAAGTAIPSVRHFSHQALIDHDGILVSINPREAQVPRGGDVVIASGALAGQKAIAPARGESP
jgi:NAD-dependent SIR2 family protein deacetylase